MTHLAFHVNFISRFGKWEESFSHTNIHLPSEYLLQQSLNHYLAGGEGQILVHNQRLILIERSLVTGIRILVTVYTTRIYETCRCAVFPQITNGTAGEVWTEAKSLRPLFVLGTFNPIGIHRLSCRMVRWEIQIIKGEQFAADIIFAKYFKAQGEKGIVQVILHLRNRMECTLANSVSR